MSVSSSAMKASMSVWKVRRRTSRPLPGNNGTTRLMSGFGTRTRTSTIGSRIAPIVEKIVGTAGKISGTDAKTCAIGRRTSGTVGRTTSTVERTASTGGKIDGIIERTSGTVGRTIATRGCVTTAAGKAAVGWGKEASIARRTSRLFGKVLRSEER